MAEWSKAPDHPQPGGPQVLREEPSLNRFVLEVLKRAPARVILVSSVWVQLQRGALSWKTMAALLIIGSPYRTWQEPRRNRGAPTTFLFTLFLLSQLFAYLI
jgi:hypothetical protein